ncbi:electron transport complex subunit E [Clostridium sp. 'deep sea']|uniref:electron transport complex subunit RsxE n=1 Tax=Clostridium sp. 'deep sea' TaxID=2779445 RepID=UPI0018967C16|nr:electron transport complex subunit E [Clostridium sp. 'deep sea']QOR36059.1 electron transport complex subunit E [Clostridium sp. 'deep sea']
MKSFIEDLRFGIFAGNPVFVMLLGMCPTLGVTTKAVNAIGMGLATTFVLLGSNLVVSLLRKVIPGEIRIPAFIVIIATFVTLVDLLMLSYLPDLHAVLGIFIPLIVVNCLILQRAEALASKNSPGKALTDAFGMGIGFTIALTLLACIREFLGSGTLFNMVIIKNYIPFSIMKESTGGFITLGLLLALFRYLSMRKQGGKKA